MSDEEKDLGGRPTKYEPAMCERVIELMRDGASKHEVAADLGIAWQTFLNWQKDGRFPEFMDAVSRGELLSQAWWERAGRSAVMGTISGFNAASWIFNMKNRFGWRDKHDHEVSGRDGAPLISDITVKVVRTNPEGGA
jgi:hypothetical protein